MNWIIIKKSKLSINKHCSIYSCKIFFDEINQKLKTFDEEKNILLLDILDFLIDKGNSLIWKFVSSKNYFLPIINLLKIQNIANVQKKLLSLIKKWGEKFEDNKAMVPNFTDIYTRLKNNGVEFPEYKGSNYSIYFTKKNNKIDEDPFYYFEALKDALKEEKFKRKYRKLVSYLLKMNEKIKLANQLIDLKQGDKLTNIIQALHEGNSLLIETITGGKLLDDVLMDYTISTSEDINNTIIRENELKNHAENVSKFVSNFENNNIFPREGATQNIENGFRIDNYENLLNENI